MASWKKVLRTRLIRAVRSLRYLLYSPASRFISIHCPEYADPPAGKEEKKTVDRIANSFRKMKEEGNKAPGVYLPSSLWQKLLSKGYAPLASAFEKNDTNKAHRFLSNFGASREYLGVESSDFIRNHTKTFLHRRYLINDVFANQLKIWKWFYNGRKPVSSLSYPRYGNQAGAFIDGNFAGPGSFFNEIYGSILAGLVRDVERPVVAELGAGYGKLAYFILRDIKNFSFIDFDLPETLCLAAYYLMMVYPDKRALLYGEEEFSRDAHKKYDLIFMPSYEIEKAPPGLADLFINKNSLGEMSKEAAANYTTRISKATKRFFFHMNHEIERNVYDNGEKGLLGYEYPVPEDEFTLLFRYPDIGHMLCQGFLDFNMDIFAYLYERKR